MVSVFDSPQPVQVMVVTPVEIQVGCLVIVPLSQVWASFAMAVPCSTISVQALQTLLPVKPSSAQVGCFAPTSVVVACVHAVGVSGGFAPSSVGVVVVCSCCVPVVSVLAVPLLKQEVKSVHKTKSTSSAGFMK